MALAANKVDATEALIAAYPAPSGEGKWASDARSRALTTLRQSGAPVRRDEYWKFTNPARLLEPAKPAALFETGEAPMFDGVDKLLVVFVDGVLRADLSDDLTMDGVEIETLSSAMSKDIHWAGDIYGVLEANGQNPVPRPMAALNTAVAVEGLVIRVTGKATKPIALRYQA
jgi:Fe-S cluster assembly protein SufD